MAIKLEVDIDHKMKMYEYWVRRYYIYLSINA